MTEINAFENGSVEIVAAPSARPSLRSGADASYLISHIEWEVPDGAASAVFLSSLFAWQFKRFSEHYWLFEPADGVAIGLLETAVPATINAACPAFIAVPNIEACLEAAAALGASLVEPRSAIAGYGAWAKIKEPGGNAVGLFERFTA